MTTAKKALGIIAEMQNMLRTIDQTLLSHESRAYIHYHTKQLEDLRLLVLDENRELASPRDLRQLDKLAESRMTTHLFEPGDLRATGSQTGQ
jgi:hypothetical protein